MAQLFPGSLVSDNGSQLTALHNLSFQVADHLSDLVSSIFPDSKTATYKTRYIIIDAIDPYFKDPILNA